MDNKEINISDKEIVERMSVFFEERWCKNQSYGLHRLKEMKSQPLKSLSPVLHCILRYVKELSSLTDNNYSTDKVSLTLQEEVSYWERQNGYCIYISVLIKVLFSKLNEKDADKLVYYQGFSDIQTDNPFAKMIFGERQIGLHAWLTYENRVIDATASQHSHSILFDFGKLPMVIGTFPKTYRLAGFKENDETITEYTQRFAAQVNKSEEEWLESHLIALDKITQKSQFD